MSHPQHGLEKFTPRVTVLARNPSSKLIFANPLSSAFESVKDMRSLSQKYTGGQSLKKKKNRPRNYESVLVLTL